MAVFVCRWQNGDFSVVQAESRAEAIIRLDELANAEVCELFQVTDFMAHFCLENPRDDGDPAPFKLEGFGEDFEETIVRRAYPIYEKTLGTSIEEASREKLTESVARERRRLWGLKKPEVSTDPEALYIQLMGHDIPKAVAEEVVHNRRMKEDRQNKQQ